MSHTAVHPCSHVVPHGKPKPAIYKYKANPCPRCRSFPCGELVGSHQHYYDLVHKHSKKCPVCKARKARNCSAYWQDAQQIFLDEQDPVSDGDQEDPAWPIPEPAYPCDEPVSGGGDYFDNVRAHVPGCRFCTREEKIKPARFWADVGRAYASFRTKI